VLWDRFLQKHGPRRASFLLVFGSLAGLLCIPTTSMRRYPLEAHLSCVLSNQDAEYKFRLFCLLGATPQQVLGLSVEVVRRTPKPTPEKIARSWVKELAKEGQEIDWQKLLPCRGFEVLPRRWVVERTFAWLSQNRQMSKDYERLCSTGETFVYAAMSRLMARRLARA
jgi:hypothetical protein